MKRIAEYLQADTVFLKHIRHVFRILLLSIRRFAAGQHSQRAVALTYYTLFAIVPLAALSFGIAKGFDIENRLRLVLNEKFSQHEELLKYVYHFADTTLKQSSGGLVAGVGVIALFWTVVWLAGNIEKAFNAVWGLPPRKNIFRKFSDYLAIMLLVPVLLVIISSAGIFLRAFFDNLSAKMTFLGDAPLFIFDLLSKLTPITLIIVLFTLIYLRTPNTKVRIFPALFAGIIAGILFQVLQDCFFYLQSSIYRYNRIYGSFAALPLFLIWMQWSWQIALFGAEIGFVCQKFETGLFDDDNGATVTPRNHRILQLAVAAYIYRKFKLGNGASTVAELLKETKTSGMRLSEELTALLDSGVILRAAVQNEEMPQYLPALPPDDMTIAECCRLLDRNENENADSELLIKSAEILHDFDLAAKNCASDKKIFEL